MIKNYVGHATEIYKPNRFSTWHSCDSKEHYDSYVNTTTTSDDKMWKDDWGYQFNSQGFRSEEFNSDATKRIFTIGCSYTLGEGIPFKDTWSQQFKKLYEADNPSEIVNTLNFSISGGSNDYISRMCLTQLNAEKPDLLVVQFSFINRAEYVNGDDICLFGPWDGSDKSKAYYANYTKQGALIKTIKNMLQVQFYCEEHNIDYIFSIAELEWFDREILNEPMIKSYADLLNKDNFSNFCIETEDFRMDYGRDIGHPGPITNKKFANRLYDFYTSRNNYEV